MTRVPLNCFSLALTAALTVAALFAPSPVRADEPAPDPLSQALVDSSSSELDVKRDPPAGGDLRRVGVRGTDTAVSSLAGVRRVGSGWYGHRAAFARGVAPAAMTEVTLRGRWAEDWIDGGLDLLAATAPAPGVLAVPSGHDLSIWPVVTAEWAGVHVGGTAPLTIDQRPLRRPAAVPFSRLSAASGSYGRSLMGTEFGRSYAGGSSLTGYFETEDGRAPSAGGRYGFDRAGGAALADIGNGWTAEVGGTRVELDRSRPEPEPMTSSLTREYVRTDLFARGASKRVGVELFHTQSWLESVSFDLSARSTVDGVFASLGDVGPVDAVRFQLERRAVSGALLSEPLEEMSFRVEAADTLDLAAKSVALAVGAHALGGEVVPRASVSARGELSLACLWSVEASLWGRHPTALERSAIPRELSGPSGNAGRLGGSPLVGPEHAAALSATMAKLDVLAGIGARVELLRVLSPVVVAETDSLFVPANAGDETGGVLSAWAAAGDTSGLSGSLDLTVFGLDPQGALNSLTPVPSATVRAAASLPFGLFEDYIAVRVAATAEFEHGLARGPWSGLVEDSRAVLSIAATAAVGSARLFIVLDDVLASDHARTPGMAPDGTTLRAGFSWRFRD